MINKGLKMEVTLIGILRNSFDTICDGSGGYR